MKVLVTGASGFIGTKLVPRLVRDGHEVTTFGRAAAADSAFAGLPLEHRCGDVTDAPAVVRAVRGQEVVYHLAGLVSYRSGDRERQRRVNVAGTANVMEACLNSSVRRVVHTSSIAGMGVPPAGTVGTEEMPYNLSGLGLGYCDSKHESEQEALKYAALGLPVVVLCPGIIFGEGDTHPHHRAIFAAISRGWLIGCPAGGVTFCDIEDVVAAHVNAMTMGRAGERYVLGSANLTYREAAGILCRVLGGNPPRFIVPGPLLELCGRLCEAVFPLLGMRPPLTWQASWLSQRNIFFSSEKAIRELAMPVTSFEETIRRTYPYYLGLK